MASCLVALASLAGCGARRGGDAPNEQEPPVVEASARRWPAFPVLVEALPGFTREQQDVIRLAASTWDEVLGTKVFDLVFPAPTERQMALPSSLNHLWEPDRQHIYMACV